MAVGAEDAAAVGVVQQHEITDEFVLVGGDLFAERTQIRVAIAGRYIAEHLVVSPVFLDDVNDVLEHARFTRPFRHRTWRLVGTRGQFSLRQQGVA